VKQTHRTPKLENPGAGGRGATRRRMKAGTVELDDVLRQFSENLDAAAADEPFVRAMQAAKQSK
jgi:hypothetical protein